MNKHKSEKKRTLAQNRSLHKLFSLLAETLNENGLDMRRTLKPEIAIEWTGSSVKEHLWRPIQEAQLNKRSTTELTTKEIDEVFDTINKHLGERFGLHVPFPSVEDVINREYKG